MAWHMFNQGNCDSCVMCVPVPCPIFLAKFHVHFFGESDKLIRISTTTALLINMCVMMSIRTIN
jgi:hypothetical protein